MMIRRSIFYVFILCAVLMVCAPLSADQKEAPAIEPQTEEIDITQQDQTGTDPRGFGNRFMPYYWYGELENDLEIQEFHLFGMFAFDQRVAMTYDWPVAKKIDYSDVEGFKNIQGSLPPNLGGLPGIGGGGLPFDDLDADGDVVGMGDLNLRFFYMPKALDTKFTQPFGPNKGKDGSMNFIFGFETTLPTATEDVLGNDAWIISPMFTFVMDTPFYGFIALMNFYDFDAFKESGRPSTSRYRGRWFLMQPLSKPGPGFLDGWYLLPEMQPIYDFEESDFSFWIGPELGKILGEGKILYAKPGWGIDTDPADRDFTFEAGFRWFF